MLERLIRSQERFCNVTWASRSLTLADAGPAVGSSEVRALEQRPTKNVCVSAHFAPRPSDSFVTTGASESVLG